MKTKNSKRPPWMQVLVVIFTISCALQAGDAFALGSWTTNLRISQLNQLIRQSVMTVTDNSASNVTFTDTPSNKPWVMNYEHTTVSIPVGDMVIPIEIKKPTAVLTHPDLGRVSITDGVLTSVTRTPLVITSANPSGSYSFRPTLYITLNGFPPPPNFKVETDPYQKTVAEEVAKISGPGSTRYSQYVVFTVDWDSEEAIYRQLEDLSKVVKGFLNERAYPWDVVIMGKSRGGIFAHQLAEEIRGHQKINNLHTFLLEATAATFLSDHYPTFKHSSAREFNSMFYDGKGIVYVNTSTTGDQPINGYTNYGLGVTDQLRNYRPEPHINFAEDWVADKSRGLERAFNNIWNYKAVGSFTSDGQSRQELVRIRSNDVFIDGSASCDAGNWVPLNNLWVIL